MLDFWGNFLTFFNSLTGAGALVLIFESFFARRKQGWGFWGGLALWYLITTFIQFSHWSETVSVLMAILLCLFNAVAVILLYRAR